MTPEQKDLILEIMGGGIVCGMTDLLEAYCNHDRMIGMFVPYTDVEHHRLLAEEAMLAFFNANPSDPGATPWTAERLDKLIDYHFNGPERESANG